MLKRINACRSGKHEPLTEEQIQDQGPVIHTCYRQLMRRLRQVAEDNDNTVYDNMVEIELMGTVFKNAAQDFFAETMNSVGAPDCMRYGYELEARGLLLNQIMAAKSMIEDIQSRQQVDLEVEL